MKEGVVPTMYFIGVTTSGSSILRVFPAWMRELGRPDVVLEGIDLQLHDEPAAYRAVVERIKHDPLSPGALVTSHKITLLAAARDLFDELDPLARISGEVSSISKRDGLLWGHAKDPIACGLSLEALLGPGYFGRTGAHVLCLGAGGSATAMALHFAGRCSSSDRPTRLVMVDRLPERIEGVGQMVGQFRTEIEFELHCHSDPKENDELMAALPAGSLVINATGMGKDLPGSPATDAGLFPRNGIAWELNYRGERQFLRQAMGQSESRGVRAEDGWLYFVHGWSQVIAEVLQVDVSGPVTGRLEGIARSAAISTG